MSIKKLVIAATIFLLSASALADPYDNYLHQQSGVPFFATLSIGPAWVGGGDKKNVRLEPDVVKTYTINSNTDEISGIIELFAGYACHFNESFITQLGLEVAVTSSSNLTGDVWEDANPNFNNFTYTYKVRHQHIAAKAKFIGDLDYMLPYFSVGLGYGMNNSSNFSISPKIYPEIPAPPFGNNDQSAFTYSLGAGLDMPVTDNFQIGIGYEFLNWGKTQLAPAWGQTTNSVLSLSNLYTQQFLINFTYLA
nr:outer membrane beta-barrel protein [Legionella jordanis]